MIKACNSKRQFFDAEWAQTPCWDMILSLFVAEQDGREMTLTLVSEELGLTGSTAARYLDYLIVRALVSQSESWLNLEPAIRLTAATAIKMSDLTRKLAAD
jgi:DNA-binding IclR family transcriptional regulator